MMRRRQFLALISGAFAAGKVAAQLDPNVQAKRAAALEAAIRKVTGGKPLRSGKVKLQVPPLVDNGNTVALSVAVDSPMTEADHVKAIHIFTEKNPQPNVISIKLGPRAGKADIQTRVRLADTQTVVAICEMSDGSFWSDKVDVVITLGACLEDPV
jgi:sulfur-oxidizing protein SoxY